MNTLSLDIPEPYQDGKETGTTVQVHAGFPNPAAERSGTPLSLDKLLIHHPSSTYFFRIRGHNWHRYGVFDGDIAVVDRAYRPHERDLVVWWQESGDLVVTPFVRANQLNAWGTITSIIHSFTQTGELT
ncbi:MAG TPA: S24 family peptidase [Candidatus Saccharimonadales bacterium]|nr:S24 family peptidase [Candidatus Saccharimonadales bacterium]